MSDDHHYHEGEVNSEDSLKEEDHSSHSDHHHGSRSDKLLLAKTLIGTKTLKVGTVFVIGVLVMGLLGLGFLAKTGVFLTPLVLPLAFLPVGVIALALFVPLICLFVPIIAVGLVGGAGRRRKRRSVGGSSVQKSFMRWQDVDDEHFHYLRDILQQKSEMIYFYPPAVKEVNYRNGQIGISLINPFLRPLLQVKLSIERN